MAHQEEVKSSVSSRSGGNSSYYTLGCDTDVTPPTVTSITPGTDDQFTNSLPPTPRTPVKNTNSLSFPSASRISLSPRRDIYNQLMASPRLSIGENTNTRVYQGMGTGSSGIPLALTNLRNTDSGQSSLEYWDYSVELEMLNGATDLQLAAELGKTLLERNRSLEATIQQQQTTTDDHLQEIEYLSKQTAALREVNDSRLLIYEQLEISLQDLEKSNQRLTAEAAGDKRKLKNLCNTIETLESRNEELQRNVEEAESAQVGAVDRGRDKRRVELLDEAQHRRSASCEHGTQEDSQELVLKLRNQLKDAQTKLATEASRREETEVELANMSRDHQNLQEQMFQLQERLDSPRTLDEELKDLDETSSERYCSKCQESVDETASNPTVFDLSESYDDEPSTTSHPSKRALVRLNNGGMAWGSQESLASLGQVISQSSSNVNSPGADLNEVPENSLCSEFNTQYRVLIDKYEKLVAAFEEREQRQEIMEQSQTAVDINSTSSTYHQTEAEEISGPMSMVLPNDSNCTTNMKCQRCTNCSCGITLNHQRPKSNMEEYSEVETSSSGFSEGESRFINKVTQTEYLQFDKLDDVTPTEFVVTFARFLDLKSPVNPCDQRFKSTPEYKKLFHEIFTVLKETVHANELKYHDVNKFDEKNENKNKNSASYGHSITENELAALTIDSSSTKTVLTTSNSGYTTPSGSVSYTKKSVVSLLKNASNALNTEIDRKSPSCLSSLPPTDGRNLKESSNVLKPIRPNSLDLVSNASSRSSSKNRRRKSKQKVRKIPDSLNSVVSEVTSVSSSTSVTDEKPTSQVPSAEIISSDLCTKHRNISSRKKNRRNRSRNSNSQRTQSPNQRENIKPTVQTGTTNAISNVALSPKINCSSNYERPPPRMKPKNTPPHNQSTHQNKSKQFMERFSANIQKKCEYTSRWNNQHQVAPPGPNTSTIVPASVVVAQLRGLEQTYAEVLKASYRPNRTRRNN